MAETIKAEGLLLHASADGAIAQGWFAHQGVAELFVPPKELAGRAGDRAAYCDVALHSSTNVAQGQPAMASVQDCSSSTVATGVAPPEGVRRDEREGLLQPKSAEQLLQPKSAEQSEQKKQAGEVTYGVAKANHELLCEWKIFNLQRGCQSRGKWFEVNNYAKMTAFLDDLMASYHHHDGSSCLVEDLITFSSMDKTAKQRIDWNAA